METSNISMYMFQESEVYLGFPCPKNKHELSLTDLYSCLSAVQLTVGHICGVTRERASGFLFRQPEAHDSENLIDNHKKTV